MSPESYHTQHAPLGAFASFTIGLIDAPGGFGQSLAGPAEQNVYIGYRPTGAPAWQLLPYLRRSRSQEANFTGVMDESVPSAIRPLSASEFVRRLGWCSDTWSADDGRFGFALLTPLDHVPDPTHITRAAARRHFAPVVCGWIEYDNRTGRDAVELLFGLGDPKRPFRPLDGQLAGFAAGTDYGFATRAGPGVSFRQGFDLFTPKFRDHRGRHVIGTECGIVFTIPAGERRRFPLALGFFAGGEITTGIRSRYLYTRYFKDLEDVLSHGLRREAEYRHSAAARDRELAASGLDADQQFLVAQAAHSYLGSTQLMEADGTPLWIVNEGEYRMMNTFDLTVDHLFHELRWHPWSVRNVLDVFATRYAYTDSLQVDDRQRRGGISFTHDMGVLNQFTPPRRSSYECENVHGCFSHMTMEQLLNWVLCAVTYAEKTGDRSWLRHRRPMLDACAESLRRRDHPIASRRDGILKFDSDRCGTGSEITTYDSLDVSLGQARNNLYLSVKALGAWLLLERAYASLGDSGAARQAGACVNLATRTLTAKFEPDTGFFPAVFEAGNRSRIIPAVEGLAYPLYLELPDVLDRQGRFGPLLDQLEGHLRQALQPGVCLDPTTGGWKLSSTSTNTWFSKIALAQWIVRKLFPTALSEAARRADRVHADWQRRPGCGANAMCDQIRSHSGEACGSKYYPRGVTSILWVETTARALP